MKIYILELQNNKELYCYLKNRYNLTLNIYESDVIIIGKVYNIKLSLELVDYALNSGKEIICIKNKFSKESYVSNYLIKNGAMYI